MTLTMRHTAEYLYPGMLFPEEDYREIPEPTLRAAVAAQPNDKWYAVNIATTTRKLFTAADGEETWVDKKREKIGSWLVGEKTHWSDLPDDDRHRILRSNIQNNSDDGYGVKTRRGNWQIASDYDHVVSEGDLP